AAPERRRSRAGGDLLRRWAGRRPAGRGLIEAVVLDYGNVLSLEQEGEAVTRLEGLTGAEATLFAEAYWRYRDDFDRGVLDGAAYWRSVAADLGVDLSDDRVAELVREDAQSWVRLNERMVAWLWSLVDAGVPTAILSNMARETWELAGPPLEGVPATVSFELGVIKPEPEIYHACLARLGVEPREAVFVDDRPVNVEAARQLGMQAFVFVGADELRAELEASGFPFPLP
ncbi:MAG TPA: HAD family phosphatase, partial [Solirubrobacterales bacterium]|nr:HAD family phosphatase [Solirubrobacterales bacterium]